MKLDKIKHTPQGFSYVDVSLFETILWGGAGICADCGEVSRDLKLIWVIRDTFCDKCFNEWLERCKSYSKKDVEYDLNLQKDNDIRWYKMHGVI